MIFNTYFLLSAILVQTLTWKLQSSTLSAPALGSTSHTNKETVEFELLEFHKANDMVDLVSRWTDALGGVPRGCRGWWLGWLRDA
jgi:hypothetical protein